MSWVAGIVVGVFCFNLLILILCVLRSLAALAFSRIVRRTRRAGALERTVSLPHLIIAFLIVYFAAASSPLYDKIEPSAAICLLLGALAVTKVAFSVYVINYRKIIVVLFVFYLVFLNNQFFTAFGLLSRFKNRFPHMDVYYDDPGLEHRLRWKVDFVYSPTMKVTDPDASRPGMKIGLIDDETARDCWVEMLRQKPQILDRNRPKKPKLVVVCVSGGGTRSAFWTGEVLKKLESQIPGFDDSIRVITGASGGMLGASYYVEARYQTLLKGNNAKQVPFDVPIRSLDELVRYIALRDIPRSLVPRLIEARDPRTGEVREYDRGTILEDDWKFLCGRKFTDYAKHEADGKLPSLIFSPMIVEDGRQLLISNLDLQRLPRLDPPSKPDPLAPVVFSRGARSERNSGTLPGYW